MSEKTEMCNCSQPLLGERPGVGPRCRLCNKLINPHDPPVQAELSERPENKAETRLYAVLRMLRGNPSLPESMFDSAVADYFAAARAEGRAEAQQEIDTLKKEYHELQMGAVFMNCEAIRERLRAEAAEAEVTRERQIGIGLGERLRDKALDLAASQAEVTRLKGTTGMDRIATAVRADILHAVEQEARKRAIDAREGHLYAADYALTSLADFCRQQRE